MKTYLLTVAVAALFATPAVAETSHSGLRAEGRLGYDRLSVDTRLSDGVTTDGGQGHDNGVTLGAEVGYDGLVGQNLVVGGYVTADFASISECGEVFGGDRLCATANRNIHIGGRVGVASGHALFYAKGGYSRGRFGLSYNDGVDSFSAHDHRGGWHLGAGAELNLSDRSYIKAEYIRTNYKAVSDSEDGFTARLDAHRDQVVFGVGLRF